MSDTVVNGSSASDLDAFRLGSAKVFAAERKLVIGVHVHKLEPKVMHVLLCLARQPGEVVSRRELLEQVWPRSEVSDEVLSRCVYQLRRLLDDSTAQPQYIETVPKAGYRLLIAPTSIVEPAITATLASASAGRLLWAGAGCGLIAAFAIWYWLVLPQATAGPPTVAVSPVTASGNDGGAHLLAMALNDRIRSALAEHADAEVAIEWLQDPAARHPVVREAGPQYSVYGELESIPGESRALLHLFIDSLSDGRPVSTPLNVFEVPYLNGAADIVDVDRYRDAIVGRILLYLGVELPFVHYHLSDLEREAFRLLMHADWELYSGKDCGIGAQSLLQRSVELNPESARAWAQLGEAYWHQVWDCARGVELLEEAERALAEAARLDPTQSYGVSLHKVLLLESGAVEEAYAATLDDVARAPDDVYVLYAKMQVLVFAGFLDHAAEVLATIDSIDPLALSAELVDVPMALLYAGRLNEFSALAPIKPIPRILYYRALAAWRSGDPVESRRLIAAGIDARRSPSAFAGYLRALDRLTRGDRDQAAIILDREVLPLWADELGAEASFRTAQLLAMAGDTERAAQLAARSVRNGFFCPKCFVNAPGINELADHPALTAALRDGVDRHLRFAQRFGLPPELSQ